MKRGLLAVLFVSLTLNAGFLGAAAYQMITDRARAREPESPVLVTIAERPGGECGLRENCGSGASVWVPQRVECLSRRLCLEPCQKARLNESLAAVEVEALPAVKQLCRERVELSQLIGRPDADPGEVRERIRRLSCLQSRVDSLAAEGMLREMEVLRPEQRSEYRRAFCLTSRGPN